MKEGNTQPPPKQALASRPIVYRPQITSQSAHFAIISQFEAIELRARNMLPSFTISQQLASHLQSAIGKAQEKCDVLFGTNTSRSKRANSYCLEYSTPVAKPEDDDTHLKTGQQQCFCASYAITRSKNTLLRKFEYELERCLENREYLRDELVSEEDGLNELQIIYFQLVRVFLLCSLAEQQMHKAIFFPNVNLMLREVKLKCKYASSEILSRMTEPLSSQADIAPTFGYLVPDSKSRIVIYPKSIVNYTNPSVMVMGVWAYARDLRKDKSRELNPDKLHLVWSLITNYISQTKLQKCSMFQQNQGLFILFAPGENKPTVYLFECKQESTSNRWAFCKSTSKKLDMAEEITFDALLLEDQLQQVFVPEEKEVPLRKQISSPIKKQVAEAPASKREFPSFANNSFARSEADSRSVKQVSDRVSQKSYDERDVQIQVLKQTLEFYKKKCEDLERELLNHRTQQQQQQYMPFYHPMMHPQLSIGHMVSPMNGPTPMIHPSGTNYLPLYHSTIGPHQQFMPMAHQSPHQQYFERLNGSNQTHQFSGHSMSQSYVVMSRDELGTEQKVEQEQLDSAFAKKQHTVESNKQAPPPVNGPYTTPVHRLGNNTNIQKSDLRINLAEQFSESPQTNQNVNCLNGPVPKQDCKDQRIQDSPKFQLQDLAESYKEKPIDYPTQPIPERPRLDTLEMSFKGYSAVSTPSQSPSVSTTLLPAEGYSRPPLAPKSTEQKAETTTNYPVSKPQMNHRFMESFSSDTEPFVSEFVKPARRVQRPVACDSDDDEDMKVPPPLIHSIQYLDIEQACVKAD